MRKARALFILGIWVAVLPHLGFPSLWKNILFLLSGLALIYLSYLYYAIHKGAVGARNVFDNFSENSNFEDRN